MDLGGLVTAGGWLVAGARRRLAIDPVGLSLMVDPDGTVRQGETELGRLRVVDFSDLQALRQDGHGNFVAPSAARATTATAEVHQGALEDANTNGIEELVAMIGVQRSFESMAHVLSAIEESYRRLTRPF
jgi:flagellar basal body rod protein FlgG